MEQTSVTDAGAHPSSNRAVGAQTCASRRGNPKKLRVPRLLRLPRLVPLGPGLGRPAASAYRSVPEELSPGPLTAARLFASGLNAALERGAPKRALRSFVNSD